MRHIFTISDTLVRSKSFTLPTPDRSQREPLSADCGGRDRLERQSAGQPPGAGILECGSAFFVKADTYVLADRGHPDAATKSEIGSMEEGNTRQILVPSRAVDHESEVLEVFATKRRDRKAALKFLKRLMKRYGRPWAIVTDRLGSYPRGDGSDRHRGSPYLWPLA